MDNPGIVGGKAWNVGRLKRLFPDSVPTGFVVCFPRSIHLAGRAREQLKLQLVRAISQFIEPAKMYAVRSSAIVEDSPSASFAGQFFTGLAIRGVKSVANSIFTCIKSQQQPGAVAYSSRMGISSAAGFACLIQELVPADKSGVAFTKHPTSAQNAIVINAAFGLGNLLVNGEITPDTVIFDRSRGSSTYEVGSKRLMSIATTNGLQTIELPPDRRRRRALDGREIAQICKYAESAEVEFHCPLDIEWAIAREKLFLLQCRPITTRLRP